MQLNMSAARRTIPELCGWIFRGAVLLGLCITMQAACTGSPERIEADTPTAPGVPTVTISAGSGYSRTHWFGIFPFEVTPQIAVWAETEDGMFSGTLFLTKKAATGAWDGGKNIERPEALPVFFTRSTERSGSTLLDASSSATPKLETGRHRSVPGGTAIGPGRYMIFAEVNSSFDFNDAWPEAPADVNGQPSLLYAGELEVGENDSQVTLALVGHSILTGNSTDTKESLEGITTAKDMIESIRITVKGGTR